jgi:hypothetical protein
VLPSPFLEDLATVTANDGSVEGAARWLIASLAGDRDPIRTFDEYVGFIEGVGRSWPVMRLAAEMFDTDLGTVARFVADRIPAAAEDMVSSDWCKPVTQALVIADRAHDIAAFFSVGLKPNGSKDPFALRRSTKHFIIASALLPRARCSRIRGS